MEFIESFFGLSPDGGSGALEALYLAPVLIVFGLLAMRVVRARSRS